MAEKLCHDMESFVATNEEKINEDMLKQCRDIEIECQDITKCRRKKFCCNTRKLSRHIKFRS